MSDIQNEKKSDWKGRFFRAVARGILRAAFRPKITYQSNKAREAAKGPCVIISNHIRGFDCAVLQTCLPKLTVWSIMAKDYVEKDKLLARFVWLMNAIFVDRSGSGMSMAWLKEASAKLKAGDCVFIAPEGYCQFGKGMIDFKPGFAMLGAMSGAQVLPIYNSGEYHVLFGPRVRIMIGDPIQMEPMPKGLSQHVLMDEAFSARYTILSLEKQLTGSLKETDEQALLLKDAPSA